MDLFTQVDDIRVSKLSSIDVDLRTDKFLLFEKLLREHEAMYPGILKWFQEKVKPGIIDNSRIAYLGFNNDKPIATAVVKVGLKSKFCHLSISADYQNRNIGELFFIMMALDAKRHADEIHFTLPETLWDAKSEFFKSFGFVDIGISRRQYRSTEEELSTRADFNVVWRSCLRKLPKIVTSQMDEADSIYSGILLSVRPKYTQRILSNEKFVEIRKQFNKDLEGCRVTLYATSPSKQICGHARIGQVKQDSPSNLWNKYESQLGCTREEFDKYSENSDKVYAIFLTDIESYKVPVPLTQLNYWLDRDIRPPQSYYILNNNQHWAKAVSIAELLQGRFRNFTQFI